MFFWPCPGLVKKVPKRRRKRKTRKKSERRCFSPGAIQSSAIPGSLPVSDVSAACRRRSSLPSRSMTNNSNNNNVDCSGSDGWEGRGGSCVRPSVRYALCFILSISYLDSSLLTFYFFLHPRLHLRLDHFQNPGLRPVCSVWLFLNKKMTLMNMKNKDP